MLIQIQRNFSICWQLGWDIFAQELYFKTPADLHSEIFSLTQYLTGYQAALIENYLER